MTGRAWGRNRRLLVPVGTIIDATGRRHRPRDRTRRPAKPCGRQRRPQDVRALGGSLVGTGAFRSGCRPAVLDQARSLCGRSSLPNGPGWGCTLTVQPPSRRVNTITTWTVRPSPAPVTRRFYEWRLAKKVTHCPGAVPSMELNGRSKDGAGVGCLTEARCCKIINSTTAKDSQGAA
jgi:hypothetical protein